jgi:hypothetical protein
MKKGYLSTGIHNMQHLLILCGGQVKNMEWRTNILVFGQQPKWQKKPIKNKGVIRKLNSGLMTKQIDIYTWHSSQNTLINLIIYSEASVGGLHNHPPIVYWTTMNQKGEKSQIFPNIWDQTKKIHMIQLRCTFPSCNQSSKSAWNLHYKLGEQFKSSQNHWEMHYKFEV